MSQRRAARRRLVALAGTQPPMPARVAGARAAVERHPVVVTVVGTVVAGAAGGAVGGPVAAVIAAGYAWLGLRAARRVAVERRVTSARLRTLDAIGGLAADLRAGVAPAAAMAAAAPALRQAEGDPAVRSALDLVSAARIVSEGLGAPLADLLDRVEADLRGAERRRVAVSAQTAGARASAGLLALLPAAGVALGYGLGARPGHVLLHTPLGAACALSALALQGAGLIWTGRLCRGAVERAS